MRNDSCAFIDGSESFLRSRWVTQPFPAGEGAEFARRMRSMGLGGTTVNPLTAPQIYAILANRG